MKISIFLLLAIFTSRAVGQQQPNQPMNLSPQEQLAYATVRIECTLKDGSVACGTGFFFQCAANPANNQHVPVIVTNRHVVEGAVKGKFLVHVADSQGQIIEGKNQTIELDSFQDRWIPHPDANVDLCVLPIAPLTREAETKGIRLFYISIPPALVAGPNDFAELAQFERIMMVGYPIGIWDSANNMPVFRAGVTATHPKMDYDGRREFMIDAACFPGSSGSPVLLFDNGNYVDKRGNTIMGQSRIKLLGVLYAGPMHTTAGEIKAVTIPTKEVSVAYSRIPTNLGFVIKATRLLEFDGVFETLQKAH